MSYHPGRQGNAWWKVRKQILANATNCAICGRDLDFNAPPKSKWSPSVDHITPLSALRHLPAETQRRMSLDPANLRAVHYGCNSRKGNRMSVAMRPDHSPEPDRSWMPTAAVGKRLWSQTWYEPVPDDTYVITDADRRQMSS